VAKSTSVNWLCDRRALNVSSPCHFGGVGRAKAKGKSIKIEFLFYREVNDFPISIFPALFLT
jgi:hypothetical protein